VPGQARPAAARQPTSLVFEKALRDLVLAAPAATTSGCRSVLARRRPEKMEFPHGPCPRRRDAATAGGGRARRSSPRSGSDPRVEHPPVSASNPRAKTEGRRPAAGGGYGCRRAFCSGRSGASDLVGRPTGMRTTLSPPFFPLFFFLRPFFQGVSDSSSRFETGGGRITPRGWPRTKTTSLRPRTTPKRRAPRPRAAQSQRNVSQPKPRMVVSHAVFPPPEEPRKQRVQAGVPKHI